MSGMRPHHLLSALLLAACGDDAAVPALDAPLPVPTDLTLPGNAYYPENVHAAPDGTLYVPSLGTGEVVTFAPGATTPTTFIAAGDPKGVSGLFATAAHVWVCAVDLSVQPPATEVREYSLAGALLARHGFSQPAFCNDLIESATGDLFVSDSFGAVWKLPAGGGALAVWKADASLAPPTASGFGADGLALDGAGHLFVTNFSAATLLRIAIASDGTAGAITPIAVTPAPGAPDGMRWLGGDMLVWADGAGSLAEVALAGDTAAVTTLASGLDGPTSVVRVGATYWVSEGQLAHLLGGTPPTTPFTIRAIPTSN